MGRFQPQINGKTVTLALEGRVDAASAPELSEELKKLIGKGIEKVVFSCGKLEYISSAGLRAIVFAKQKIGAKVDVYVIGASADIQSVIKMTGFDTFLKFQDTL